MQASSFCSSAASVELSWDEGNGITKRLERLVPCFELQL
jgi:hypothetical protein